MTILHIGLEGKYLDLESILFVFTRFILFICLSIFLIFCLSHSSPSLCFSSLTLSLSSKFCLSSIFSYPPSHISQFLSLSICRQSVKDVHYAAAVMVRCPRCWLACLQADIKQDDGAKHS